MTKKCGIAVVGLLVASGVALLHPNVRTKVVSGVDTAMAALAKKAEAILSQDEEIADAVKDMEI